MKTEEIGIKTEFIKLDSLLNAANDIICTFIKHRLDVYFSVAKSKISDFNLLFHWI